MGASNWVYIVVDEVLRETDKAFLLKIGDEETWMPRSQIAPEDEEGMRAGDSDFEIGISEWIAKEKGIEA